MQRPLRYNKLPRRVVTGYVVSVNIIRALFVVNWLQFESRMIEGQNVGEAILGPVAREISKSAGLVWNHVLQLIEFFAESQIRVCGHNSVVVREVI